MNILFYFPTSLRANSLSSLMIAFREMGHEVHFVSHDEKGELQAEVEPHGVKTQAFTTKIRGPLFYWWHYRKLKQYTRLHSIDIVFSHTQQANIIACFLVKSKKTRVILCRHHTDYVFYGNNTNAKRFDAIINKRGKEFIVPALKTQQQMVENEKVDSSKITIIPYGYDFSKYPQPDPIETRKIKDQYKATPFLLSIGRMMPEKRHAELLDVMLELKNRGSKAKLIILGDGELRAVLDEKIQLMALQEMVYLPGRKTNVMDYLAACDLLIHNSESETSCSVVKEAALVEKPVVVCSDVGDFDEYLTDGKNARIIPKYDYKNQLIEIINAVGTTPQSFNQLGIKLKDDVLKSFSIGAVAQLYNRYFTK